MGKGPAIRCAPPQDVILIVRRLKPSCLRIIILNHCNTFSFIKRTKNKTYSGSEKTFGAGCAKIFLHKEKPVAKTSRFSGRIRSFAMRANIELTNLVLNIQIGSYTESDVVPDKHILDIVLSIDPELVLIDDDKMNRVFDYDPLIWEIQRMAAEMHYETQERFITRIVDMCAKEEEIMDVENLFCENFRFPDLTASSVSG